MTGARTSDSMLSGLIAQFEEAARHCAVHGSDGANGRLLEQRRAAILDHDWCMAAAAREGQHGDPECTAGFMPPVSGKSLMQIAQELRTSNPVVRLEVTVERRDRRDEYYETDVAYPNLPEALAKATISRDRRDALEDGAKVTIVAFDTRKSPWTRSAPETRAGNQPDPYVSGLAQAGIRAERDRRIIERHVRWHDEALRLLQQVNTGYEGEWPEIADFVRRSTARIEQSSSEKAAAPQMAMLPNDHHPGPRCSCRDCQRRYPENRSES